MFKTEVILFMHNCVMLNKHKDGFDLCTAKKNISLPLVLN